MTNLGESQVTEKTATKAQHTPGPWSYAVGAFNDDDIGATCGGSILSDSGYYVAAVHNDVAGGDIVARANATLIAAAPELLEALSNLVRYSDDDEYGHAVDMSLEGIEALMNAARAAIAKAEGR